MSRCPSRSSCSPFHAHFSFFFPAAGPTSGTGAHGSTQWPHSEGPQAVLDGPPSSLSGRSVLDNGPHIFILHHVLKVSQQGHHRSVPAYPTSPGQQAGSCPPGEEAQGLDGPSRWCHLRGDRQTLSFLRHLLVWPLGRLLPLNSAEGLRPLRFPCVHPDGRQDPRGRGLTQAGQPHQPGPLHPCPPGRWALRAHFLDPV